MINHRMAFRSNHSCIAFRRVYVGRERWLVTGEGLDLRDGRGVLSRLGNFAAVADMGTPVTAPGTWYLEIYESLYWVLKYLLSKGTLLGMLVS
jgi:hypothetical protein